MQRDVDLVRQILLHVESSDEEALRQQPLAIHGYDLATVARHVELMQEAGLVDAHVMRANGVPPYAARALGVRQEQRELVTTR